MREVRLNLTVPETTWRKLRDLAEESRGDGRPSVARVAATMIREAVEAKAVEAFRDDG